MPRRARLLVLPAVLLSLAVALFGLTTEGAFFWRPLTPRPLAEVPPLPVSRRSKAEHDARYPDVPRPYEVACGERVLVLGCEHTADSDDPQLAVLRQRIASWSPTLVLVEGRLGWCVGGPDALTDRFGESGTAAGLAWKHGIDCATLEPAFEAEARDTVDVFGAERTLAFYFLRVYVGDRNAGSLGDDPDDEALRLLRKRADRTGLHRTFASLREFDEFWNAHAPDGVGDWRALPARSLWRDPDGSWLQRVAEHVNAFRDRYSVARIAAAAEEGERVLVVQGLSHTILAEPALRAAIANLEEH